LLAFPDAVPRTVVPQLTRVCSTDRASRGPSAIAESLIHTVVACRSLGHNVVSREQYNSVYKRRRQQTFTFTMQDESSRNDDIAAAHTLTFESPDL